MASPSPQRFRTTVILGGKTATGFEVPEDVVAALGRGKKPPVRPSRSISRAFSTRRCRVSGFLALVTDSVNHRCLEYEMPSKNAFASGAPASASARSGGTSITRGASSSSRATSISSPAATPAAVRFSALSGRK